VTTPFEFQVNNVEHLVAVARCVACHEFILAMIKHGWDGETNRWLYLLHYPLGKPNDSVSTAVPEAIRLDFQEALRCQWVKAYNATAEMCRRAVESTCLDLGAPYDKVLEVMIDWLEEKRKITPALKDVAHKIRLSGNRGAHPVPDTSKPGTAVVIAAGPILKIEPDHAEAIVSFTRHLLEHVYIIPQKLPQFDFSKPKVTKK